MTTPTLEQQVDALWAALQSSDHWLAVSKLGGLMLFEVVNPNIDPGAVKHEFHGSREEIIAQLIAMQVAEKLKDDEQIMFDPAEEIRKYGGMVNAR